MLRHQQTTQRDRSLEELDKAIAATKATSKKAAKLVQDKEARAKAAQTRKVKLKALLNVVCDDCATIPCLLRADHNPKPTIPASFQSVQTCIVCGNPTDRLVDASSRHGVPAVRKGGDAPTASQLESELASHIGKTSPSATAWNHALHQTKVALNAPTRQQMLKQRMAQRQDGRADASGVCGHAEGRRGRGRGAAVTASARVDARRRSSQVRRLQAGAGGGRTDAAVRRVPCGQVCIRRHARAVRQRVACLS